ncbi:hypothetical protein WBG06_13500 [Nocardioides sp. CCNWLW239]|uniref:hypothetical protein n=1 Tax=Nocardioides sp. CCNWLW239 TaxID=3128902 RepID=UPI00301ABF0D
MAGILTGGVVAGLGVVVFVAGLAGAERPDRDPVIGYEDVDNSYPDVDQLPPLPASTLSGRPSARPGGVGGGRDGATYEPAEPTPTAAEDSGGRTAPREPLEPGGKTDAPTPVSTPTRTPDPEPTAEPTEPVEQSTEPTPTETATPSADPQ